MRRRMRLVASSEIFYRAASSDTDVNKRERIVEGVAVPYGVDQPINATLVERFEYGAFAKQIAAAHRTFFARSHVAHGGRVIGKAVELRESKEGLIGKWRVSETPLGDETLTLLEDGVLQGLSVGFRAKQSRKEGKVTVRVSAHLVETAVVEEPAYGDLSVVTDVREVQEISNFEKAQQILASLPVLPPRVT